MKIEICSLCEEQSKKTRNGKPHEYLVKVGEPRIFPGKPPQGFEEQDYQCLRCKSKFTWSSSKTDLVWTLWQG